jgi:gamma-glutamyltranspeptidase/glutathione hydrolase
VNEGGGNSVRYRKKAMIVAPQPEATEAGADALREDGNAVDAGITCALVQGVIDPMMCGIAGFGSCGIYMPGKKFHGYLDAHAPAPLASRPDMWANLIESEARDGYGFVLKGRMNDIGYKSICAPANLKMYFEAHREHGSLPWSRIVEPAIHRAENGWTGARTSISGGPTRAVSAARPTTSASASRQRHALSTVGRTDHLSGWARRW